MCGIVGAVSTRNIVPVLIEGLRRLEYRGYDSCGVAVQRDGQLQRARTVSRVADLDAQALKNSRAGVKLQLGPGLGAGGKPARARELADAEREIGVSTRRIAEIPVVASASSDAANPSSTGPSLYASLPLTMTHGRLTTIADAILDLLDNCLDGALRLAEHQGHQACRTTHDDLGQQRRVMCWQMTWRIAV